MGSLKTHLVFAFKVAVAMLIVNAFFDALGQMGLTARSYFNNPITAIKGITGIGNSGS